MALVVKATQIASKDIIHAPSSEPSPSPSTATATPADDLPHVERTCTDASGLHNMTSQRSEVTPTASPPASAASSPAKDEAQLVSEDEPEKLSNKSNEHKCAVPRTCRHCKKSYSSRDITPQQKQRSVRFAATIRIHEIPHALDVLAMSNGNASGRCLHNVGRGGCDNLPSGRTSKEHLQHPQRQQEQRSRGQSGQKMMPTSCGSSTSERDGMTPESQQMGKAYDQRLPPLTLTASPAPTPAAASLSTIAAPTQRSTITERYTHHHNNDGDDTGDGNKYAQTRRSKRLPKSRCIKFKNRLFWTATERAELVTFQQRLEQEADTLGPNSQKVRSAIALGIFPRWRKDQRNWSTHNIRTAVVKEVRRQQTLQGLQDNHHAAAVQYQSQEEQEIPQSSSNNTNTDIDGLRVSKHGTLNDAVAMGSPTLTQSSSSEDQVPHEESPPCSSCTACSQYAGQLPTSKTCQRKEYWAVTYDFDAIANASKQYSFNLRTPLAALSSPQSSQEDLAMSSQSTLSSSTPPPPHRPIPAGFPPSPSSKKRRRDYLRTDSMDSGNDNEEHEMNKKLRQYISQSMSPHVVSPIPLSPIRVSRKSPPTPAESQSSYM